MTKHTAQSSEIRGTRPVGASTAHTHGPSSSNSLSGGRFAAKPSGRRAARTSIAFTVRMAATRATSRVNSRLCSLPVAARPANLGRSAVLAALAVTTVGGPVQALVRDNGRDSGPVQHVVIAPDGAFVVDDAAAGATTTAEVDRDSLTTSRAGGRAALPAQSEGDAAGETDESGAPMDVTETGAAADAVVEDAAPQVEVDAAAEWTSVALAAAVDGTASISADVNIDRLDLLERARALLDSSAGKVTDEARRTAVADGIAALEAAGDQPAIQTALAGLENSVGALEQNMYHATTGATMAAAESEARAALARGATYDPAERLDFGSSSWAHPVPNGRFTSGYGPRGSVAGASGFHIGIDLAAPSGTPIHAVADGVVTYVGMGHSSKGLTGWVIVVSHGEGLETSYNHMYSSGVLVQEGEAVRAGDVIGAVGSSGRSTGPHLHLSVWIDGQHVNPRTYLNNNGVRI